MAILEVENLSFSYPKCDNNIIFDLSFTVNSGEVILVMGETGVGKSTLLRLLKDEIKPYGKMSGSIKTTAENIGFVFQNIDESIVCDTVLSELSFPLQCKNMDDNLISAKLAEVSAYFNLTDILHSKCADLSGGMKQMVSLASAMINAPDILILDEPTSQLDPVSAGKFINMLTRINRELGTTVIMATHSPGEIIAFADKILFFGEKKSMIDTPKKVAAYLKNSGDATYYSLPIFLRLFDAMTVNEARKNLSDLSEKPLEQYVKNEFAVKVSSLYFAYDKKGKDVLTNLSYKGEKGKINAIIGANSGGKTTFLKILCGVKKQLSGKVKLNGSVSMLYQNPYLTFTADKLSGELDNSTIENLGLSYLKDTNPFDLSGGEARIASFGKVLERDADIVLLDEPTCGLDSRLKNVLIDNIKLLKDKGKTVIVASHDLEFLSKCADNVSFLYDGYIPFTLPTREFFSSLDLYTTDIRRITNKTLKFAVTEDDLV